MTQDNLQLATLGGGCFWCVEAVFEELKGVERVVSGYTGGPSTSSGQGPTYAEVCSGKTEHAEVAQISFDPSIISYGQLLNVFFTIHDPTTLNRQGHDVGAQYRSVIFYHDAAQKQTAEKIIAELESEKVFADKIVTQVVPYTNFYPATEDHQDYYANNPSAAYCELVINPKLDKLREKFAHLLK